MRPEASHVAWAQAPASPEQAAIDDFRHQLEKARRQSAIDGRHFIITKRIIDWFMSPCVGAELPGCTNAVHVLRAVCGIDKNPREKSSLLNHANPEDPKCWLRTFAILLQLDYKGANMGKHIHRFFELDVLDSRLGHSVRAHLADVVFPDLMIPEDDAELLARRFDELEWQLCTDTTLDGPRNRLYRHGKKKILPITQKVPLKEGGTSIIYMIEVPSECVPPSLASKLKRTPHKTEYGEAQLLTLKVVQHQQSYDHEIVAYSALAEKEGILECFGWWKFAFDDTTEEYHLLLEWGAHDLTEFFRCWPPPTTTDAILQFWEDLLAVVSALGQIHEINDPDADKGGIYYGWHCDIKPANILFCEEGRQKGWKIADPGFAQFIRRSEAAKVNGLPIIEIYGGTTSYGAPEAASKTKAKVSQRFDIWSLGCVLSEASTWVVLGHRGVQQFHHVRQLDDSGIDRFHDGIALSQAVCDWHTYLRQSLRASDSVTAQILTIVEDHMLQGSPTSRDDAIKLKERMIATLRDMRKKVADGNSKHYKYKMPLHFLRAIDQEQRKEAAEIQFHLENRGSEKGRDKYKSKAFLEATEVPLRGRDERENETAGLLPASHPTDHFAAAPARSDTMPASSSRTTYSLTWDETTAQGSYRISTSDLLSANYREARVILEEAGWKSGALELPGDLSTPDLVTPTRSGNPKDPQNVRLPSLSDPPPATNRPRGISDSRSIMRQMFGSWRKRKSAGSIQTPTEVPLRPLATVLQDQKDDPLPENTHQLGFKDHRYDKFDTYFKERDIAFLIDNGWSMHEHWIWARDLLSVLTAFLYKQDDDGMDLYFTSRRQVVGTFKEPKQFVEAMDQHRPQQPEAAQPTSKPTVMTNTHSIQHAAPSRSSTAETSSSSRSNEHNPEDIRYVLKDILDHWATKFKRKKKKLTLIILTDGIWHNVKEKHTVADEIVTSLQRWQDKDVLKKQLESRGLSIQFVRFGDNEDAKIELDRMDTNLTTRNGTRLPYVALRSVDLQDHTNIKPSDIIDHEPADGNIYKMILGSLDERYDIDDEVPLSDSQSYLSNDISTPTLSSPMRMDSPSMPRAFQGPSSAQTFDVVAARHGTPASRVAQY
ncbi:hypothetical protein SCARD494_00083 [Seiridium cardinale]